MFSQDAANAPLGDRIAKIFADSQEALRDLETRRIELDNREVSILAREQVLKEGEKALEEGKATLEEEKTTFKEEKNTLKEEKSTLQEEKTALDSRIKQADEIFRSLVAALQVGAAGLQKLQLGHNRVPQGNDSIPKQPEISDTRNSDSLPTLNTLEVWTGTSNTVGESRPALVENSLQESQESGERTLRSTIGEKEASSRQTARPSNSATAFVGWANPNTEESPFSFDSRILSQPQKRRLSSTSTNSEANDSNRRKVPRRGSPEKQQQPPARSIMQENSLLISKSPTRPSSPDQAEKLIEAPSKNEDRESPDFFSSNEPSEKQVAAEDRTAVKEPRPLESSDGNEFLPTQVTLGKQAIDDVVEKAHYIFSDPSIKYTYWDFKSSALTPVGLGPEVADTIRAYMVQWDEKDPYWTLTNSNLIGNTKCLHEVANGRTQRWENTDQRKDVACLGCQEGNRICVAMMPRGHFIRLLPYSRRLRYTPPNGPPSQQDLAYWIKDPPSRK